MAGGRIVRYAGFAWQRAAVLLVLAALPGSRGLAEELKLDPASLNSQAGESYASDLSLAQAVVPKPPAEANTPLASPVEKRVVTPGKSAEKPPAEPAEKPPAEPAEPPPEREPAEPSPDLLASLAGGPLAEAPNMYGDSRFSSTGSLILAVQDPVDPQSPRGIANLPLPGADRVAKIAENGNVMPHDRAYFLYNHFNGGLRLDMANPPFTVNRLLDVDRYTLGFEKALPDDRWSVELRMPLFGRNDFQGPSEIPVAGFASDRVGNLAVILKRLVYRSEDRAFCLGLGIDTPTGGNVQGFAPGAKWEYHNQAVHLLPYAGLLGAPTQRLFYQAFLQVDVAANGNRVDSSDANVTSDGVAYYHEQTLLYADLEVGYWLYRNRRARWLTGLASVLELHYTSTLQNTDSVSLGPRQEFGLGTVITNPANRVDVVNMTVGLHAELARNTLCRVAGVFPLSTGDNRAFDAEIQVQVERRF